MYLLLFAGKVGASDRHPLEAISADGLEHVHERQLYWQHQSVADFLFHNNHLLNA